MNTFHLAIAVGLLIHLAKKYIFTPGWDLKKFFATGWPYVLDSIILCGLFALWGPGLVQFLLTITGVPENAQLAIAAAPGVIGTLIGLVGGSFAYDIPVVGPALKRSLNWYEKESKSEE